MKKYRVTKKHPFYKLGVIFEETKEEIIVRNTSGLMHGAVKEYNLDVQVCRGFIEEIQQPEFTRDDMKSFFIYAGIVDDKSLNDILNDWIEEQKK